MIGPAIAHTWRWALGKDVLFSANRWGNVESLRVEFLAAYGVT
jgi:hypothetical protein